MGLFDSFGSLFSTIGSDVSGLLGTTDALGGSVVGGLDTGVSPIPVSIPTYSGVPEIFGPPAPAPMPMQMPMAMPAQMGSRSLQLQSSFPNLYGWILSHAMTIRKGLSMLVAILRKWGPNILANVVGWAVVNELLLYLTTGKGKRRRMNVANTRALRRSMRRLKGFHRLATRVEMQLSRSAGRRRSVSRRCNVCRHSPCTC